jgi:rare lipoprotein A
MRKTVIFLLFVLPLFALAAHKESGTASFYGVGFHGRPTASGEIYNQYRLTAAHKTLPLGTIVKVTNPQNNKSVFLKINDRGPFIKGRIIDVSTKAAEMLGFRNKGTAYVNIEVVDEEETPKDLEAASEDIALQNGISSSDNTEAATSMLEADEKSESSKPAENQPFQAISLNENNAITNRSPYYIITHSDKSRTGFYGLQLGVFSDISAISCLMEELEAKYKQNGVVQRIQTDGKTVYKLMVGKFQNRAYADAMKATLAGQFKDASVVKYD